MFNNTAALNPATIFYLDTGTDGTLERKVLDLTSTFECTTSFNIDIAHGKASGTQDLDRVTIFTMSIILK